LDIEYVWIWIFMDIGFEYQSTSDTKVYTTNRV